MHALENDEVKNELPPDPPKKEKKNTGMALYVTVFHWAPEFLSEPKRLNRED